MYIILYLYCIFYYIIYIISYLSKQEVFFCIVFAFKFCSNQFFWNPRSFFKLVFFEVTQKV